MVGTSKKKSFGSSIFGYKLRSGKGLCELQKEMRVKQAPESGFCLLFKFFSKYKYKMKSKNGVKTLFHKRN